MLNNLLPAKIILASNNAGKLREFKSLFSTIAINIVPQSEFNVEDAVEDGLSFVENAIIKARHAAKITKHAAIADDSGIEIDALSGQPGIYSARFSGEHGNDKAHNQLVLKKMAGIDHQQRTARFQCVLAFMRHENDPTPLICQASWEGFILEAERGDDGFGYDPLFYVPEHDCTAAQLPADLKNKMSHRAQALQILLMALKANYPTYLD
jgi:XTP/dITP diphosphohydrolase